MSEIISSKEVQASKINFELDHMRRDLLLHTSKEGEGPHKEGVRATLSNIIILSGADIASSNLKDDYSTLIEDLAKVHPSRFFVVSYVSAHDLELKTKVVTRKALAPSGSHVHTEEIHIEVGPENAALVKNLILSHLIPDIETIAIEIGSFPSDAFSINLKDSVMSISDTLIAYTPRVAHDSSDGAIGSDVSPSESDISYHNLSWPMISRWCSLISEQFDSEQSLMALKGIRAIKISYSSNNSEKVPETALLFAAWMLKCLSLTLESSNQSEDGSSTLVTCRAISQNELGIPSSPITLEFIPSDKEGLSQISEIQIEMQQSEKINYRISCKYVPSSRSIEIISGGEGDSEQCTAEIGDTCEFYIRRITVQSVSTSEAVLELIRAGTPIDLNQEYLSLLAVQ